METIGDSLRFHRVVALLLVALAIHLTPAAAQQLPDWPRPPTESDCRAFQSAIEDFYTQADEEYKACTNNSTPCGSAPGRRGAASAKRAEVHSCFYQANLPSASSDVIEFLARDKNDPAVSALGSAAQEAKSVLDRLQEVNELRKRLSSYQNLSDNEKLDLHRDLAMETNAVANSQKLSKTLTANSLQHIAVVQKDALAQLDRRLGELTDRHKLLISRRDALSDIRRRTAAQIERSADADYYNQQEIAALRSEILESRAVDRRLRHEEQLEMERRAARANEMRARLNFQRQQDQISRDAEAAAAFNAFLGSVSQVIGGSTGSPNNGSESSYIPRGSSRSSCPPGPDACAIR